MTSPLSARKLRELEAALRTEQSRLGASISQLEQANRDLGEYQAGESDGGGAAADVASELLEQEIDITLEHASRGRLDEVEAALRKFSSGSYGRCERCGNAIPVERLEVQPWAATCVGCASQRPR